MRHEAPRGTKKSRRALVMYKSRERDLYKKGMEFPGSDQYSQLSTSGAQRTKTIVMRTQGNQPILMYSFMVNPAAE